jgi:rsbT co-antagonist protein RsbR
VNSNHVTTSDPRTSEILAMLAQLESANWGARATPSGRGDELDLIIAGLNRLADALAARHASEIENEQRFEDLVDVISAMAALDFTKRATVGDQGTAIDALSFGINILSEELAESMVSKDYVDNILESMNDALVVVDRDRTITTVNRTTIRLFGYPKEDLIGQPYGMLFERDEFAQTLANAIISGEPTMTWETTCRTSDGQIVPVALSASALHDSNSRIQGMVCFVQDITERRQAEQATRQSIVQEETIRAQAAMLAELSTPLIPISDALMVMPLVGAMDSRRAQQVLDTLLQGVAAASANVVLLDITGVPIVDTQVANTLIHATQAVKLLGAQVILTGIRPEVAQTLVGLGVDLRAITTHATLQSGIATTMRR